MPAIIADFILILNGRKPVLMAIQRKLFTTLEVMKPFLFNNYYSAGVTDYKEILQKLKG